MIFKRLQVSITQGPSNPEVQGKASGDGQSIAVKMVYAFFPVWKTILCCCCIKCGSMDPKTILPAAGVMSWWHQQPHQFCSWLLLKYMLIKADQVSPSECLCGATSRMTMACKGCQPSLGPPVIPHMCKELFLSLQI